MTDQSQFTVCILFEDEDINSLFAELLIAHGASTRIIKEVNEIGEQERLITEPRFFEGLNGHGTPRCLVVGNKESLRGLDCITLSRPLTELKIVTALEQFLSV